MVTGVTAFALTYRFDCCGCYHKKLATQTIDLLQRSTSNIGTNGLR